MTKSKQQNVLPTKSKRKVPSSTGAKTLSFPILPNVEKLILATFVQVESDVNELLHLCSTWREKERTGAGTLQSSVTGYYEKKVTAYLKDFFARRRALVKAEYERSKGTLASEGLEEEATVSHLITKTDKASIADWRSETLKDTKGDLQIFRKRSSSAFNIIDTHRLSEEQKNELKESKTFFQKVKDAFERLKRRKSHKKTPQTKRKHLDDDIVDSKSDESSSQSGTETVSSPASATSTEAPRVFEEPFTEGGKEKRKSEETEALYTDLPCSLQEKSTDIYSSRHKESADETKLQKESSYSDSIEHEQPSLETTSDFGLSGHTKLPPGESIFSTESDIIDVEGSSEDQEFEVEDSKTVVERVKSAFGGLRKRKSRKKTQQTDDDVHTSSESEDEESYSQPGSFVTSPSTSIASTDICSVFVEPVTEGGKSEESAALSADASSEPFSKLIESFEKESAVKDLIPQTESSCKPTEHEEPLETHSESEEPVDKPVVTTLRSQTEVGKEEYKSKKTETRPSEVCHKPFSKLTESVEVESTDTDLIIKIESTYETTEQRDPLETPSESKEIVHKDIGTTSRRATLKKAPVLPGSFPSSTVINMNEKQKPSEDQKSECKVCHTFYEKLKSVFKGITKPKLQQKTQQSGEKRLDKHRVDKRSECDVSKPSFQTGSRAKSPTPLAISAKISYVYVEPVTEGGKEKRSKSESVDKPAVATLSRETPHKSVKIKALDEQTSEHLTRPRVEEPNDPSAVTTESDLTSFRTESISKRENEDLKSEEIHAHTSTIEMHKSQEPNYISSVKRELDSSEIQNEEEIQPGIAYVRKVARCMSSVDSSEFTHTACDLIVSKIQDLHLDWTDQRDNEGKSNKTKTHTKLKSSSVSPTHAQELNDVSDATQLDRSSFHTGSIMEAEHEELKSEQDRAVVESELSATSPEEHTDEKHIQIKLDVQKKLASIPSEHLADLKQSVITTIMGVFDFIGKNPTEYIPDSTKMDTITNTLITSVESIFEGLEMQPTSSTGGAAKYPEMAIPSETSSTKSCCSRCKEEGVKFSFLFKKYWNLWFKKKNKVTPVQ